MVLQSEHKVVSFVITLLGITLLSRFIRYFMSHVSLSYYVSIDTQHFNLVTLCVTCSVVIEHLIMVQNAYPLELFLEFSVQPLMSSALIFFASENHYHVTSVYYDLK